MADPAFDPFAAAGWTSAPPAAAIAPPAAAPAAAPATNDNPVPVTSPSGQWTGYTTPGFSVPDTGVAPSSTVIDVSGARTGKAPPVKIVPATPPAAPVAVTPAPQSNAPRSTPTEPFDAFKEAGWTTAPAAAGPAPAGPAPVATGQATPPAAATPPAEPMHPILQQELHNQPWYQPMKDAVQDVQGGAQEAVHHLTAGFDEIALPIPAAIQKSFTQGIPFSQAYDQAVAEQRVNRKQFEALYPQTSEAIGAAADMGPAFAASPLFGISKAGAGILPRAVNYARNIIAGAGAGAVSGFGMTEGDVGARLQGAEEGAAVGGAIPAVAPIITGPATAVGKAVYRAATPNTQAALTAGKILNEAADEGGGPATFRPSPIPGAPLDVGQSSGNAGLASLVDSRDAANQAAFKAKETAQNQAIIDHLPGPPRAAGTSASNVAPEQAATRGSARAVKGVEQLHAASDKEEKRLWNTPAMRAPSVSTQHSKDLVQQAVDRLKATTPGLHDAYEKSELAGVTRDLLAMPEKTSANELNSIASRYKAVLRSRTASGAEKAAARELIGAAEKGLWDAPEVAGRLATTVTTPAHIEYHAQPDGTTVPVHIAAKTTTTPAVKPIPGLVQDMNRARVFTKREAEVLGYNSFGAIMARNSFGNRTVVPGTAMNSFFDFANGVEKPGLIQNTDKFLNDIKASWLRLNQAGGQFDPAHIDMAKADIKEGLQQFITSKMLAATSSGNLDARGNQLVSAMKLSDWLGNNIDMLERTGAFSRPQMDAFRRVLDYARLLNQGNNLGKMKGAATYSRLTNEKKWLDLFMSPILGTVVHTGISAAAGAGIGTLFGGPGVEGFGLGAILGSIEGGVGHQVLRGIYNTSRRRALEKLDEAVSDPVIARDLMQKATRAATFSPRTKAWIKSWMSLAPADATVSSQQPALEPAQ